jgi:hypothetical protein
MSRVCLKGLNSLPFGQITCHDFALRLSVFALRFRSHARNALQIWQLQSFVLAIGEASLRKLAEPVTHTLVPRGRAMQRRLDIRVQTATETC